MAFGGRSEHLAARAAGRFMRNARPLAAVAPRQSSALTALGTICFEEIFEPQFRGLGKRVDVLIASLPAQQQNVIARSKPRNHWDYTVDSQDGRRPVVQLLRCHRARAFHSTPKIQEMHIGAPHMICQIIETLSPDELRRASMRDSAGGRETRLAPWSIICQAHAARGRRPFLEHLVCEIRRFGSTRFVLPAGYRESRGPSILRMEERSQRQLKADSRLLSSASPWATAGA